MDPCHLWTGPFPSDEQHRHFGKGQTETTLDLPPGEHTLRLLFADSSHEPYDPAVTDTIKVTVTERRGVSFAEPQDGIEVTSPFVVRMGTDGVVVEPASEGVSDGHGHHHIIIDADLPPAGQPIPSDDKHRHFGKGQTEATLDLTSPEGFLNSQLYFLLAPILLLVFAISAGSGAVAGEEEKGSLDLLFSHPVRRSNVVTQKLAAMIVAVMGLSFILWLTVVVGALIVNMDIGMVRVAEATLSAALLASLFGALALALGCATGKRGVTIGVSGAVIVLAYLINALRPIADAIDPARFVSPFYYYIDADPISNGLDPVHALVLVAVTASLAVVGVVAFERRDIAV